MQVQRLAAAISAALVLAAPGEAQPPLGRTGPAPPAASADYDAGMAQVAARNSPASAPFFEKACKAGDLRACFELGKMHDRAGNEEFNRIASQQAALRLLEGACNGGHAAACVTLGKAMDFAPTYAGQVPNRVAVTGLFVRGCELENVEGCSEAALAYELGRNVPRDTEAKMRFRERACELNDALSCWGIGVGHMDGVGGWPRDWTKARQYFNKAETLKPGTAKQSLEDLARREKQAADRAAAQAAKADATPRTADIVARNPSASPAPAPAAAPTDGAAATPASINRTPPAAPYDLRHYSTSAVLRSVDFIQPSGIQREGDRAYVWLLNALETPRTDKSRGVWQLFEVVCTDPRATRFIHAVHLGPALAPNGRDIPIVSKFTPATLQIHSRMATIACGAEKIEGPVFTTLEAAFASLPTTLPSK